jgi:hypothetical protein
LDRLKKTVQQPNISRNEFRAHLLFHFTFFVASDPINICITPDTVAENFMCVRVRYPCIQALERSIFHTKVMDTTKSPMAQVPRTASNALNIAQRPGFPNHTHPLDLCTYEV